MYKAGILNNLEIFGALLNFFSKFAKKNCSAKTFYNINAKPMAADAKGKEIHRSNVLLTPKHFLHNQAWHQIFEAQT